MSVKQLLNKGFTIIELIVVIVVIGILATIIVIAYNGVQEKAIVASLKVDISNCKKAIEIYKVENGNLPINDDISDISFPSVCQKIKDEVFTALIYGPNDTYKLIASYKNIIVIATNDSSPNLDDNSNIQWVSVSAGIDHTCAISYSGSVYCWGSNMYGRLGDSTTMNRTNPTLVSGGLKFKSISASNYHTCAIAISGSAYCWGNNSSGQLGDETYDQKLTPTLVKGGFKFKSISTKQQFTCAITTDNLAYCWGYNTFGQLGTGNNNQVNTPTQVTGGLIFKSISAGWNHACAITTDNLAYCWGYNGYGRLGNSVSDMIGYTSPQLVQLAGNNFKSITAMQYHTCAVTTANIGYCWGYNYGRLGDNSPAYYVNYERPTPYPVYGGMTYYSITAGSIFTCSITIEKDAYCWGSNSYSVLGGVTVPYQMVPAAVIGNLKFTSISSGEYHTCATTFDGLIYCWGRNDTNQLGDGTNIEKNYPNLLPALSK